jgi:hypothetical protein
VIWALRLLLVLAGVTAPAIGYWIRAEATNNAKVAVDGLLAGAFVSLLILPVFALSFQASPYVRLKAGAAYAVIVLATWAAVLGWSNAGW